MEMKKRILGYLRGDRRGKEANSLEREALNDAFLYEALEGVSGARRDAVRDIEWLSRRLKRRKEKQKTEKQRTGKKWKMGKRSWGMVAAFVAVGFGIWLIAGNLGDSGKQQKKTTRAMAKNSVAGKVTSSRVATEHQKDNRKPDTVQIRQAQQPRKPAAPAVTGKRDTVMKGNRGSVPSCGYQKFYRYIQDSLRYPQDALERGLEGDIKLSFVVNRAGRPSHIRIVKWITRSCNKEAIRLLNEGPTWNYTGDTNYIVIPFRLKR